MFARGSSQQHELTVLWPPSFPQERGRSLMHQPGLPLPPQDRFLFHVFLKIFLILK